MYQLPRKFYQKQLLWASLYTGLFFLFTFYFGIIDPGELSLFTLILFFFFVFGAISISVSNNEFIKKEMDQLLKKIGRAKEAGLVKEKALESIRSSFSDLTTGNLTPKINEALASVASLFNSQRARLWVRADDFLEIQGSYGMDSPKMIGLKLLLKSRAGVTRCFRSGLPIVSNNVGADRRLSKRLSTLYGAKNLAYVPLKSGDKPVGVLALIDKPSGFSKGDLALLKAISTPLASCVQNANLAYQLDKRLEMEKQFLTDLAHHLKTPLTAARGEIELALGNIKSNNGLKRALTAAVSHISQTTKTITDTLNIAWSQTKQSEAKEANIASVIEETCEMARVLASAKGVSIKIRGPKTLTVSIEKEKMAQAIANILDNAIKYTPKGGKIEITLRKINNSSVIKVSDSGIGIPKKDILRVFDRFFRGQSNGQMGSGLGLPIAESIIASHKGKIDLSSQVGKGTIVTIRLPLTAEPKN